MKEPRISSRVGIGLLGLLFGLIIIALPGVQVLADDVSSVGGLDFREISLSGDTEFIVLQNVGSTDVQLGNYWIGYNSDEHKTPAPSQNLTSQILPAGQALILTKDSAPLCGAYGFDDLNFSLSNSSGALGIWQLNGSGDQAAFSLSKTLNWGKSLPTGTSYLNVGDETAVKKYKTDTDVVWYHQKADAVDKWQAGYLASCNFTPVVTATTTEAPQPIDWQLSSDSAPPFTVVSPVVLGNESSGPVLPAMDIGLQPVQLSEILPNPASPSTDSEDEFIEIYNPNPTAFDLSGFKLKSGSSGSSSLHSYSFPAGTMVAGKGLMAFRSEITHLSLSNSGGQVWILDPFNKVLAQSAPYGEAKDGLSWINTGDKWQWSAVATPGKANKLASVVSLSKGADNLSKTKLTAVKGAATTAGASAKDTKLATENSPKTSIHPWVLVAVVVVALLYGAYEYRVDLANRLYQFRRYRSSRRANR